MSAYALLQPIFALVLWSLLMWLWMYVTRLPAMMALKIELNPTLPPKDLTLPLPLPPQVRWKADNYNHLMEQPTLFYATALGLALMAPVPPLAVQAAWAYVLLRVAHSLVQCSFNHIPTRFALFVLSTLALATMAILGASTVFGR